MSKYAKPFIETNPDCYRHRADLVSLILGEFADHMNEANVGEIEMARRMGVEPNAVRNLLACGGAITLDEIADVFYSLGYSVKAFGLEKLASHMEPGKEIKEPSS